MLDESNPPFYKWFADGKLNASYNCLDRHVEAGNGDRVAFHWRGEEGEERDVTYADLLARHAAARERAQGPRRRAGDVVGIYLPMIPEVVVAMLACARIGAPHNVVFGGFSPRRCKERMEFSEAKALITVDGARRKGKTRRDQAGGRRGPGRGAVDRDGRRGPQHRRADVRDGATGRDVWYDEALEAADAECPAEPLDAEHPLLHPLHVGLDGEAEGHPAHDRRLPDRRRLRPTSTSST